MVESWGFDEVSVPPRQSIESTLVLLHVSQDPDSGGPLSSHVGSRIDVLPGEAQMFSELRSQSISLRRGRGARWMLGSAFLCVTVAPTPVSASETCSALMEWNQFALSATVTANQGALPQIRSMAIVHASVHDAVNTITGEYETYLAAGSAPGGASVDAAVIAAANYALTHLFMSQAGDLNLKRAASLAACGLDETDAGIAVGEGAAAAILGLRSTDGVAQANFPYVAPGAGLPGVWVAVGSAAPVAPGWGNVTPWVINSGSQFRPIHRRRSTAAATPVI